MNNDKKLTDKQEKFCQLCVELNNASEAYRKSYTADKMKSNTIARRASELVKEPHIDSRIKELRGEHRERHDWTIDDAIKELEEARQVAKAEATAAPMVSATMGKAKILGFLIDKSEVKSEGSISIDISFK